MSPIQAKNCYIIELNIYLIIKCLVPYVTLMPGAPLRYDFHLTLPFPPNVTISS